MEIDEATFDEQYRPQKNHLDDNASFTGCLYETSGEEFAYVRGVNPAAVWTVIDGDDGNLWIVSGLHYVDRVGYIVTEVTRENENDSIEVRLD